MEEADLFGPRANSRSRRVECEVWWCVVFEERGVGRDPGIRSAAVGVLGTSTTGLAPLGLGSFPLSHKLEAFQ